MDSWNARCCAIWSAGSIIWLVTVGIMFKTSRPWVHKMTPADGLVASNNAFAAAGIYAGTFVIAMVRFYMHRISEDKAKREEENRPHGDMDGDDGDYAAGGRISIDAGRVGADSMNNNNNAATTTTTTSFGGGGAKKRSTGKATNGGGGGGGE
jgi:hypothetical protein